MAYRRSVTCPAKRREVDKRCPQNEVSAPGGPWREHGPQTSKQFTHAFALWPAGAGKFRWVQVEDARSLLLMPKAGRPPGTRMPRAMEHGTV